MLTGVTTALSGLFTTKTGPWDIALAVTQAAAIAAAGLVNIRKIQNQTYDSSSSVSASVGSSTITTADTIFSRPTRPMRKSAALWKNCFFQSADSCRPDFNHNISAFIPVVQYDDHLLRMRESRVTEALIIIP